MTKRNSEQTLIGSCARKVRQNERRHVIRRLFTPPPFPLPIGPTPARGTEHVSPEDRRANIVETRRREIVIDTRLPFPTPLDLLPRPGVEKPVEHLRPTQP